MSPFLRKLAIAAASLALFLALTEVAARTLGEFEGPADPLVTGVEGYFDEFRQYDPLLFWSLRPGVWEEDGRITINSDGLRGPEVEAKRPGEYRVLSLGESTTFAGRLPLEETYSSRIEREVGSYRGKKLRVLNGGVPGYTLFQARQYLEHRGLAHEPDAVMLYFGFNDLLPLSYLEGRAGDASGQNDQQLFEARRKAAVHDALLQHSHAYRGLRAALLGKREVDRSGQGVAVDEKRQRVPNELRRTLLAEILETCNARGIELIVIVPWYRTFTQHVPVLREFARTYPEVVFVDLQQRVPPMLEKPAERYFLDRVHPNADGHALIARAIADVLAAEDER